MIEGQQKSEVTTVATAILCSGLWYYMYRSLQTGDLPYVNNNEH